MSIPYIVYTQGQHECTSVHSLYIYQPLALSPKTLTLGPSQEEMERGRLCFWGPSKGSSRYDVFATWKERAFAEDSAGDLGSVWPPRSYTCSFCGREFRSAQALGGHMNVHRRDRARLKLSQTGPGGEKMQTAPDRHDKDGSLASSLISSCVDLDHGTVPRVLSRSLPSYKRTNVLGDQLFPSSPYWSLLGRKQEENKGCRFLWSQSLVYPTIVEARKNISDTTNGDKLQCIEDNRMLASHQARSKYFIEETTSLKRAKISDSHTLPRFTFHRFFTEDSSHKSEVSRVKVGPWEELDLELRLGSPPKVK